MKWTDFLQSTPPGIAVEVEDAVTRDKDYATDTREPIGPWKVSSADILLHCESCKGERYWETQSRMVQTLHGDDYFLIYTCRNCTWSFKTFAVNLHQNSKEPSLCTAQKYGEMPAFGASIPTGVSALIGADRDLFFRGKRCEDQGLGIGAFGYYRRVVENQKNTLIAAMRKAAESLRADPALLAEFDEALVQTRFKQSVETVKQAIPTDLLIQGHNPLTLLHAALSEHLHAESDEQCLAFAKDIREVLYALADRLDQVRKDQSTLSASVSRLLNRKQKAPSNG